MGPLPAWCCASLEVFSWNWLLLQMWEFDPPSKNVVSDSFAGGGEALGVFGFLKDRYYILCKVSRQHLSGD